VLMLPLRRRANPRVNGGHPLNRQRHSNLEPKIEWGGNSPTQPSRWDEKPL